MSALIGIFWRASRSEAAAREAYEVLKSAVRPFMGVDTWTEVELASSLILKADLGAYGSPGIEREDHAVSAVCGHPYVERLRGEARIAHLRLLASAARTGRLDELARARGSFSFVCAEDGHPRLTLATDCLGIRPLYYADDGEKVVFSSTLAPFRRLDEHVMGRRDERAAVERGVFGYALGDRTEWEGVRCVSAGCALVFTAAGAERSRYWSLSAVPPVGGPCEQEASKEIYDAFNDAVALRAEGQSSAVAMLSGGMDSRAVVASLRSLGVAVDSLNFSPPRSQDLIYGRAAGAALGCNHTEVPAESYDVFENFRAAMEQLQGADSGAGRAAARRSVIWSGDGGSVILGHIYLTEEMVDTAEAGDDERTIELMRLRRFWTVPRRILRRERAGEIASYPQRGLLEILREQRSPDPGRRLQMLLIATDQQRHLHPYFERLYDHRRELALPFFDRKVVEAVVGRPIRPFLYHRFYHRWFELFPSAVMAVPWQTYPGHEPCPIGAGADLAYQWTPESLASTHRLERRQYLAKAGRALLTGAFSTTAASASRVALAWAATASGMRDLTYTLRFAAILAER